MGVVLSEATPEAPAESTASSISASTATRTKSVQVCADIIAALMKGPRSASELSHVAGMRGPDGESHSWSSRIRRWLEVFRASGIVYVAEWEPAPPGRWRAKWGWREVYALQIDLFGCEDAPRPEGAPALELRRDVKR